MGINQIFFQVWVSCASMRLVGGASKRTAEDPAYDDDNGGPLYTDEEYAQLEEAFEHEETNM